MELLFLQSLFSKNYVTPFTVRRIWQALFLDSKGSAAKCSDFEEDKTTDLGCFFTKYLFFLWTL